MRRKVKKMSNPAPTPAREHKAIHAADWVINRALTASILLAVMFFGPKVAIEVKLWVQNEQLNIRDNSPYITSSGYYHPGDGVEFLVTRDSNFEGIFKGVRLLRRTIPGTKIDQLVSRADIPPIPIHPGSHTSLVSLPLPDPLPPGHYYFQFCKEFEKFGYKHDWYGETIDFTVLPPDQQINENLPGRKQNAKNLPSWK